MYEVTEMPSKILINHLLTGGSPGITQWMAKNAQRWSIPQRKEIHKNAKRALSSLVIDDRQRHSLITLRIALAAVEQQEHTQYA